MSAPVKTRIVKIGNSQGIRIPKLLLQQVGLGGESEVEVEAQVGQLVIRPLHVARAEWDAAFAEIAAQGDDVSLDDEPLTLTSWEMSEWTW
ncbi:MAG TPA: AbrB/MazE/SpoVT family DNA-binding domain-containing protein [Caldilineaceae bacterium]|nr:AbrB/MazE/SpoVT family DNA-binding domain-containing protein [Caldilineaceae bacterium]